MALTVMKGYAAGILLSEKESPFEAAMTPVQCLHYCLTRPAVASVKVGVSDTSQILAAATYNNATNEEKDYSEILAKAHETLSVDTACTADIVHHVPKTLILLQLTNI